MKLVIKRVREILKDSGYKIKVKNGRDLIMVDVKFKNNKREFDMIDEFVPFLYDFDISSNSVVLYLNKEVRK